MIGHLLLPPGQIVPGFEDLRQTQPGSDSHEPVYCASCLQIALSSPPFYDAATTTLLALLITWIVGEARAFRASQPAADSEDERFHGTWIVGVALVLVAAAIDALRVLSRGYAAPLEEFLIWAGLILGILSITFTVLTSVGNLRGSLALTIGRRLFPVVAALAVGYFASTRVEGARYLVYGTCLHGGCGLKQREGPGPGYKERGRRLSDGERVLVICQTSGKPPPGVTTRVWNLLDDGLYVSDAFVDTPGHGRFSSIFPRCGGESTG